MKLTKETYFVPHCDNESCTMGTFEFICPSCKKHNTNYENYYDEFEDEFTHKCKHCYTELISFYRTGWKTKQKQ